MNDVLKKMRSICNEKIQENMYLFALLLYSFRMVFRNSLIIQFSSYTKLLVYLAVYALILPKIVFQKYNKKQLIVTGCILGLGAMAYYFNRTRNIIAIVFMLVGVKDCDLKKVAKIVFSVTAFFVCIHTFAYFYTHFANGGTLANTPFFDRSVNRSTVLCKSFNNYGAVTAFLILQYVYLTDRNKNKYIKFAVLLFLSIFFYAVGTSRTSMLISLMAALSLLLENCEPIKRKMGSFRKASFIVCVILSVSMFFADAGDPMIQKIDVLFSGRISLSALARQMYGLSLFPQVEEILNSPIILDNFVNYLGIVYGLILAGIFLVLVYYIANNHKNDWFTEYMMIVTYAWALTERYPLYVTLTLIPLVTLYNFYRDYENEE